MYSELQAPLPIYTFGPLSTLEHTAGLSLT